MDIRQLEYFVVCAEQKNFSLAAELLYTSQPHVSVVIRALETELGCKLFERTSRGMRLTPAGERNYEYARNILKTSALMLENGTSTGKHFTVYTNASSNMAVLFSKFYLTHTDYHYRYMEAGVETIIEKVARSEAEFGTVFIPTNKKNALNALLNRRKLSFMPLEQSDMVIYVGKNSPYYTKHKLSAEDINKLRFIQFTDDFFSVQELLGEQGKSADRVIETNSSHVMIQILQNSELCNLCSYWLKDRYKYYDFRMIPIEGFENKIEFGYIYDAENSFSPIAREFLEYVEDVIRTEKAI